MLALRRMCWPLLGPLLATVLSAKSSAASPRRAEAPSAPPKALTALLQRIPDVASDDAGMSAGEVALAKDIQNFAATAIPHVIALLDSNEPRIRAFAGYVLRDIQGLTEENLDALIAARKRGDGWIPPAIARIGSPRAIQFLVDDLRVRPESETQVTYALKLAGTRAAVPIARVFESPDPVSEELARAICSVLHSMASDATPALDVLLARARLAQSPVETRVLAIREIGCIGRAAGPAVPTLKAMAASEPDRLGKAVNAAILAIGSPEAVPLLVTALRDRPSVILLRDIAEMGDNARNAGPAVVALLTGSKREVRLAAARTLGFIGYDGASTPLAKLLEDKDDWRVVYVAAESLGRLRAAAALPALEKVATTHWYPPVRDSARRAASAIRGSAQYPDPHSNQNFASNYFKYRNIRGPHSGTPPPFTRSSNELSPTELSSLAYDAGNMWYGQGGVSNPPPRQTPDVGLKTGSGFLVGSSRGEWGGELMYLDGTSAPIRLLDENITGIHRLPVGIVVVTGLAHGMDNDGALYLAKLVGPGKYEVSRWKTLPGAPHASGLMGDGSLFVSCLGGDIVLKADGSLEMAGAGP